MSDFVEDWVFAGEVLAVFLVQEGFD